MLVERAIDPIEDSAAWCATAGYRRAYGRNSRSVRCFHQCIFRASIHSGGMAGFQVFILPIGDVGFDFQLGMHQVSRGNAPMTYGSPEIIPRKDGAWDNIWRSGVRRGKESIRTTSMLVVGTLAIGLVVFLVGAGLYGLPAFSARVLPFANPVAELAFVVDLLILPLGLFQRLRLPVGFIIRASSMVFGIVLWMFSAIVCFVFWKYAGLVAGLLCLGVGVFPFALLAAALHSQWVLVAALAVEAGLTLSAWAIGKAMIESTRGG
jgi:hypothetical protein